MADPTENETVSQSQPVLTPRGQPEAAPSAAFTPGPWVVWSSIYTGMAAQVRSTGPHDRGLAEVRQHRRAYRDALLMAAAPEMFEALQELYREDGNAIRGMALARAAIAKALGQQGAA